MYHQSTRSVTDVDVAVGDADPVDRLIAEFEQNFSARELPFTPTHHWSNGAVRQLFEESAHEFRIDRERFALLGVSLGGPGPRLTWRFLEERDGAVDCGVLVGERL